MAPVRLAIGRVRFTEQKSIVEKQSPRAIGARAFSQMSAVLSRCGSASDDADRRRTRAERAEKLSVDGGAALVGDIAKQIDQSHDQDEAKCG